MHILVFLWAAKWSIRQYSVHQGWEFAHQFSERIPVYLQKNEQMSDSLKKKSNSLICSFLVSNLSNLLKVTHFGERPEQFAHIAYFWWGAWAICSYRSIKKRELANRLKKKTYKKPTKKYDFSQILFFWANCTFFVSKRAYNQIVQKKWAIRSFAHLS